MSLHPRLDEFTAVIRNAGSTLPWQFPVQLTYTHDQVLQTKQLTIARLAGHGSRTLSFAGMLCDAGSAVIVIADPLDQIDVYTPRAGEHDGHLSHPVGSEHDLDRFDGLPCGARP